MEILEKVAYMKGLAEGLGLDTKSKEGKLFTIMMDILGDIAIDLQLLQTGQEELVEALDAVNDDLSEVETYLFEEEEDEGQDGVYQTTCPNCGEDIFFDESILEDGGVECPDCGKKLEFDLEEQGGQCCGSCGSCAPPEEDGFEIEDSE